MGELLTKHHGGRMVDGDGTGGTTLSRQSARIETFVPRIRVLDGGGARTRFWKNPPGIVFLGQGGIYG